MREVVCLVAEPLACGLEGVVLLVVSARAPAGAGNAEVVARLGRTREPTRHEVQRGGRHLRHVLGGGVPVALDHVRHAASRVRGGFAHPGYLVPRPAPPASAPAAQTPYD